MKNSRTLEYIYHIRTYIIFSASIFATSIIFGYFVAKSDPEFAEEVFRNIEEALGPIAELEGVKMLIAILLNNAIKAFTASFAGFISFGIIPFLFLLGNAFIIGIFAEIFIVNGKLSELVLGITPHGILEIPALILSTALGLRLGIVLILKILRKDVSIKREIIGGFYFFLKVIMPLIITSAVIETFVTPVVMDSLDFSDN